MQKIVILGANGFLGKSFLKLILLEEAEVRVLSRQQLPNFPLAHNLKVIKGDLLSHESLVELIEPYSIVINFVYLSGTQEENIRAIKNLAEVCARKRVRRLVHCSTATVAGGARLNAIQEDSECFPISSYEKTKLAIEKVLLEYETQFEIAILRPTAVFGSEGKNLLKLADALRYGNKIKNYLKSCIMGNRKMNLVSIDNVISAVLFLTKINNLRDNNIFLISDDEEYKNNYGDVEKILLKKFNIKYYVPVVKLPLTLLKRLMRIMKGKNFNPERVYYGKNLSQLGFKKTGDFCVALKKFADWHLENY